MQRFNRKAVAFASVGIVTFVAGLIMIAVAGAGAFAAGPSPTANPSASSANKNEELVNRFMANFTSRLGTDEARLNAAFTGAIDDTANQAVAGGLITQAEADQAKAAAQTMIQKGGFRSVIQKGFSVPDASSTPAGNQTAMRVDAVPNPKSALIGVLNNHGATTREISDGISAGKSLADIAAAHGLDAQAYRSEVLSTFRQEVNAAAMAGAITQSAGDKEYNAFAQTVDTIINGREGSK